MNVLVIYLSKLKKKNKQTNNLDIFGTKTGSKCIVSVLVFILFLFLHLVPNKNEHLMR